MGLGNKGGSAPLAPDPNQTADAQFDLNKKTALLQSQLNRTPTSGPTGSVNYVPTGRVVNGVPEYRQVTTLTPALQKTMNQQIQRGNTLLKSSQTPVNFNGLPGVSGPSYDGVADVNPLDYSGLNDVNPLDYSGLSAIDPSNDASRQRVEDALFSRARGQLDPVYDKQQTGLDTRLANQGFDTTSQGYRGAQDDFSRNRSNAYEATAQDAIAAGGAEQSRMYADQLSARQQGANEASSIFGSQLSARQQGANEASSQFGADLSQRQQGVNEVNSIFGLQSADRARALNEQLTARSTPLNEYLALMGANQVQIPQAQAAPQTGISPTDITGPINTQYQGQLDAYNQRQQQQNSLWGSIFGLGGKALGAWL